MAETAAVVFTGSSLKVKLPMTQPTGKIRIKSVRSFLNMECPSRHVRSVWT